MTDAPMIVVWEGETRIVRPALPGEIPAVTFDPATSRAAVLAAIARVEDALTAGVPLAEKLSWPSKEAAARAVEAGTGAALDNALLAGESALTGETVEELATRIIASADAYRFAVSRMAGIRRGAERRIAQAQTPAQLEQAVAWAEAACAAIIEAAGGV
ncbi:hypothetical protein Pan4_17 [Pseudanabaena phage Pan4]|nr:hypothetical protein Pan4_17 [Pseudanabaena phage Pan4]